MKSCTSWYTDEVNYMYIFLNIGNGYQFIDSLIKTVNANQETKGMMNRLVPVTYDSLTNDN